MNVKLVLRKDIDKLGFCGDVVEVSQGYARNFLLPHHLALEPTKANLKKIEVDKKVAAAERERKRAILVGVLERLSGAEVTISAACNPEGHLYGSVGPREISRALMDEGHTVQPDQIKMSQNIKEIGTLEVAVVLADDLRTNVKVWIVREKSADDLEADKDVANQQPAAAAESAESTAPATA